MILTFLITFFHVLLFATPPFGQSLSLNVLVLTGSPPGGGFVTHWCRQLENAAFRKQSASCRRVHRLRSNNGHNEVTSDDSNDEKDSTAEVLKVPPPIGTQLHGVTFLGKGVDAKVKLGSVLIAPLHEYHHFYRQSAIYIYAMGEHDNGEYIIRGLLLDHPTPFTLGEIIDSRSTFDSTNPLSQKLVFRGGDQGRDGVILLHTRGKLLRGEQEASEVADGIYQGGWDAAIDACAAGKAEPSDFKVFFNYCEFTETQLEAMLKESDDGDAWMSVQVPKDVILSSDWGRGDAWARLRNSVAQMSRG